MSSGDAGGISGAQPRRTKIDCPLDTKSLHSFDSDLSSNWDEEDSRKAAVDLPSIELHSSPNIERTSQNFRDLCNRYATRKSRLEAGGAIGTTTSLGAIFAGIIGVVIAVGKGKLITQLLLAGGAGILILIIISLLAKTQKGHRLMFRDLIGEINCKGLKESEIQEIVTLSKFIENINDHADLSVLRDREEKTKIYKNILEGKYNYKIMAVTLEYLSNYVKKLNNHVKKLEDSKSQLSEQDRKILEGKISQFNSDAEILYTEILRKKRELKAQIFKFSRNNHPLLISAQLALAKAIVD